VLENVDPPTVAVVPIAVRVCPVLVLILGAPTTIISVLMCTAMGGKSVEKRREMATLGHFHLLGIFSSFGLAWLWFVSFLLLPLEGGRVGCF